jgi:predicted Zn-dependent peptidase
MHKEYALPNGLRVATKSMNHMESVSIGIWIRAGGRYETRQANGISHFLEHLLFKGTKTRSAKTIKEEIEGRGGSFNGFTAEEFTCYLVKLLGKDAELGVEILSDMVLNPNLAEEEVEKEKGVIIEEINMYKDMPSHYVHEILTQMLWPDQPLGMPLAGTIESVKSIDRPAIVSYKERFYNPRNMLVIGAGNIKDRDLIALTAKHLSAASGKEAPEFSKVVRGQKDPACNLHFKETEQTHIAFGFHAVNRFHADRYVISLLNIILGANMSSRLFHIVRDEMALCYEIASTIRLYDDDGIFSVSAGVDTKKLPKAVEVILKQIRRMKEEVVSKEELRRAKEYYRGQLLFALEDTMSHMLWLGEKIITGERIFSIKKALERIDKVSSDDLRRVSDVIFRDPNLNLAVIGPVKDKRPLEEATHI